MTEPVRARILVVEDEPAIAQGLLLNLERKGHRALLAADGEAALARISTGRFDLVLLDLRLPGIDGFEVCERIRAAGDFTPILMLTARNQPDDIVRGLSAGADDYVVKPFDLAELLARIDGILRRASWERDQNHSGATPALPARLEFGPYWVDFSSHIALTRAGRTELSAKEIAVMKLFGSRPGQVVSRRDLLAEVWELPNHPNTRVVDNVIVSLRKAFEENSWRPRHIHSVRGVGYRFTP